MAGRNSREFMDGISTRQYRDQIDNRHIVETAELIANGAMRRPMIMRLAEILWFISRVAVTDQSQKSNYTGGDDKYHSLYLQPGSHFF